MDDPAMPVIELNIDVEPFDPPRRRLPGPPPDRDPRVPWALTVTAVVFAVLTWWGATG